MWNIDKYGKMLISPSESFFIGFLITSISIFVILIPIKINVPEENIIFPSVLILLLGVCFFGLGLSQNVPFNHLGYATSFGKRIEFLTFTEGLHWRLPWWRIKAESLVHQTYKEEFDNFFSFTNIQLSIKVNVEYGLGNIHKYIYSKHEAIAIIRGVVIKGISKFISENQYNEIDIIQRKSEMQEMLLVEFSTIDESKGIGISGLTIEWIKPTHTTIIDSYIEDRTYEAHIKRILSIAKELNITAEEAFRIDSIRSGKIKPNENYFRISGAKEIIEAVSSLLRK